MIARQRTQRKRADARALWRDAIRIAEQTGGLEFRADPALAGRVTQVCRAAVADAFDAVWTRKPAAGVVALREAASALDAWADVQHRPRENERRQEPPSAAAHVLTAPSLAELTLDELLELDDTDLRYALEGIALHRRLWPVGSDLRWLHAAQALHPAAGGPDDGR